jgi:hypothetical protein
MKESGFILAQILWGPGQSPGGAEGRRALGMFQGALTVNGAMAMTR